MLLRETGVQVTSLYSELFTGKYMPLTVQVSSKCTIVIARYVVYN